MSRYEIYGSPNNWRWRFIASNGRIIASGESYRRFADCRHAVEIMRRSIQWPVEIKPMRGPWVKRKIELRK